MMWSGREVTIKWGNFFLSRKGDPTDWETLPDVVDGMEAIAGNPGGEVTGLRVIDEEHLLIESVVGNHVLIGSDTRTMRVVDEETYRLMVGEDGGTGEESDEW